MSFFFKMKHIGQETLHKVYMRRFKAYLDMNREKTGFDAAVEEERMEEGKGEEEKGKEEEEDSQLYLCEKGRCERLFTETVCLKVLLTNYPNIAFVFE